MRLSDKGFALIKDAEGCRLKAYVCPAGVLTIGYGHTGPDVTEGETISKAEAELLLRRDVARFEACVSKACPGPTTQSQFDAMVSLAYNIGEASFRRSSVARLHNAQNYPQAQQAFALWNKANKKIVNGLVTRRAREADRYDDDDLPTDVADMPQAVEGEAPLAKSRTINGGVGAAASTAVTAAISAAGSVEVPADPDDFTETVLQVLPYLQQYGWIAAVVALGFLAVMIYARISDRREGRA